MQTATACWAWLVAERPDLETRLMNAMQLAWIWSIDHEHGIFSPEHGREQGSQAVYTQVVAKAKRLSRAPVLWLNYLTFRFQV
jgi:phosphatidylinositol 4-kinase